jgi:hypothetical protein
LLIMGDAPARLGAAGAVAGPWKAPNTLSAIICSEIERDVDVLATRGKGPDLTTDPAALCGEEAAAGVWVVWVQRGALMGGWVGAGRAAVLLLQTRA